MITPDIGTRYESLRSMALEIQARTKLEREKLIQANANLKEEERVLLQAKDQFLLQTESVALLRTLIEKKSQAQITHLERLVTLALSTIFHDREYSFKIEVEEKRGFNTAKFLLVEKLSDGTEIVSHLSGEVGGSIRAVVGFTLQVFYVRHFNLFPVVFLDESFSSLSDDYIPNLVGFLDKLVELRDFIFVWISHDERIYPHVNKVFEIKDGKFHEKK